MAKKRLQINVSNHGMMVILAGLLITFLIGWAIYSSHNKTKIIVYQPEPAYLGESAEQNTEQEPGQTSEQTPSDSPQPSEQGNQSPPTPQPPAQTVDPHAVAHPSIANCTSATFQAYFYKSGGTDGYASTGQSLPNDAQFQQVYFPDSYLNPPVNPITVSCVKDASDNFVDGWVSMGVWRGNTYLKMEDLTLNPPL